MKSWVSRCRCRRCYTFFAVIYWLFNVVNGISCQHTLPNTQTYIYRRPKSRSKRKSCRPLYRLLNAPVYCGHWKQREKKEKKWNYHFIFGSVQPVTRNGHRFSFSLFHLSAPTAEKRGGEARQRMKCVVAKFAYVNTWRERARACKWSQVDIGPGPIRARCHVMSAKNVTKSNNKFFNFF